MFGPLIFVFLAVLVHAQDQSGFITLDCGSAIDSNYTEGTTGLNYISDAAFVDTGIAMTMLPMYQEGMQQQMIHVRSFPEGVRNCYKFNLTKSSKYLIKTSFMYGNYDGLDKLPEFDLHIGPNKWTTIAIENASLSLNKEINHVLPSSYLHVCLVNTGSGTPFISSLGIRTLKSTLYKTQPGISLDRFIRADIGSETDEIIRYKDDVYDRVWVPSNSIHWSILNTSLDVDSEYEVPSVIMKTASTPTNATASLDFFLDTDEDTTLDFFVFLHFAEIQKLQANESRIFNVTLNGQHWYGPFSPDYLVTTTVFHPSALTGGNYSFSLRMAENSTLPPILNAMEAYSVRKFLETETEKKDVDAITNIKSMYGVKRDWQGDPCAPRAFIWEGLNCSYDGTKPPRIISINLSSNGLKGEIPSYLSNLTMLQKLDLSNNNLIGSVPDFLSKLPLSVLNLEGNNLTGSIPIGLLEREKNGLLTLSFGGNSILCSSVSCKKKKKNVIVPIAASVAASLVLIAAILAFIVFIKRKRQQVGKIETTEQNSQMDSFETKNRQFSYAELLKMTKNFERIIGKGGFGKVYYGQLDNIDVAVKMLTQSSVQGFQQFQAEVQLLLRVHHRNLTSLVGYCDEGNKLALVYEYMANGNLQEYLSDSSTNILSWEMRLRIAVESAQGLEYLHNGCKPPIIHRDVKSANILLNENFQAKLADFGLSKSFPTDANTHVSTVVAGTPGYLDPEYYLSNRLNEKSDVYSFGVVLLEIITSKQVITKINENERTHIRQWVNILLTKGDIKNVVDPRLEGEFDHNSVWKVVEVAMDCLSSTSNKRPTMSQVVMELNGCLAAEIARTKEGYTFDSITSIDQHMMSMTMSFGSELSLSAR